MKKIQSGLVLFNIVLLVLYLVSLDIRSSLLRISLSTLIVVDVIGIIALRRSSKLLGYFHNFNLALFITIVLLCLLESVRFLPGLIPLQIRNYLEDNNAQGMRESVIEYYGHLPFAKFKPNVVVRCQGYRGTNKQFVYEWRTDKLGFKNQKELLEDYKISVVAIGDSMTEGMGVAIEDTWPSILTKRGYVTYNLGVQGYKPTEYEAVLRFYGINLKPKYVIIGYCAGIYVREEYKGAQGGILNSIIAERVGIRRQSKHLITAVFLWMRDSSLYPLRLRLQNLRNVFQCWKSNECKDNHIYSKYKLEILEAQNKKIDTGNIEASFGYKKALDVFLNIKKISDEIGARVIFLYLPTRGYMYYEKATGRELPQDSFELAEARLLKDFCKNEGIVYLNPSQRMINYINSLEENKGFSFYPYLELDDHMSHYGYELVAEEIIDCLSSLKIPFS